MLQMDNDITYNWNTFHKTCENKIKGKDFENLKKIILKFGPDVYKKYYQQHITLSYFLKYFYKILDNKTPVLFEFLAESIINLYSNGDISDNTEFPFLLKMQLIISLIHIDYDYINNHPIDKDIYNAFIYTLFEESVKDGINYEDQTLKAISAKGSNDKNNKKKNNGYIDTTKQEIDFLEKQFDEAIKRETSRNKHVISQVSKKKCKDWFKKNTNKIIIGIIYDTYAKFKLDVEAGKLKYCNKSQIGIRFLNASKVYFSDIHTSFVNLDDLLLNRKNKETEESNDDESNLKDLVDLMYRDDNKEKESMIIKTYALMLIPDSYRKQILNYYKYEINRGNNSTKNEVSKWSKRNISIYKRSFRYFLPPGIKDEIVTNYFENEIEFVKNISNILNTDTVCTIEVENSKFLYWKLISDKLISYYQSDDINNNYSYDYLCKWFIQKTLLPPPVDENVTINQNDVLFDWLFSVTITDSLVDIFKRADYRAKVIIVLRKMRKIKEMGLLYNALDNHKIVVNDGEIDIVVGAWDLNRTYLRTSLQNFNELQRNIILFAIGAKYSNEKIADSVYEKCNNKIDEIQINITVKLWDEIVSNIEIG